MKKDKLVWNVYIISNLSRDEVIVENLFNCSWTFNGSVRRLYKETNRKKFDEILKSELMYYFWSKCEWEIMISNLFNYDEQRKVDVYEQVMNNWDIFEEYCWKNRKLFKNFKSQEKMLKDLIKRLRG